MRRLCMLIVGYILVSGCGGSGGGGKRATATPTASGTPTVGRATNTPAGATATPAGPTRTAQPTDTPGGPTRTPQPTDTPGGPTRTPQPTETPGGPTRTVTPTGTPAPTQVLFVRASFGDDQNSGTSFDQAFKTLTAATDLLKSLKAGGTVYVGRGTYKGRVTISGLAGTASSPVVLIADTDGSHTHDAPGAVTLDGDGDTVTLLLTKSTYVTLDGFTITGAAPQDMPKLSATAVHARSGSAHFSMRNCVIANGNGTADGIRVEASSDALIFNDLIFANDRGIIISGDSPDALVINNTIADNTRTGLLLLPKSGFAPQNATVTNNIIQMNGNDRAIEVDSGPPSAQQGYQGDFNLVFEPDATDQTADYVPPAVSGSNDINADAVFVNLGQGDVHLDPTSPAVDAGSGSIGSSLVTELLNRSTLADGSRDRSPVDLGYHYPR